MKTKLTRLWSFLLTLVMVAGLITPIMTAEVNAATNGYITKIELNNFSYSFHENMIWWNAVATINCPDTVDSHYTVNPANAYPSILQHGSIYPDRVLKAGECTIVIKVKADAGYEFIDNPVVWINGEKRTDVTLKEADSYDYDVQIHIPATVSEYTGTRYTVTYNSNGGSAVESQQVPAGYYAFEPDMPTKENMVFDGWFTDAELTNEFINYKTPITSDITLYAKWNNKYITEVEIINFYPILHDEMYGKDVARSSTYDLSFPDNVHYDHDGGFVGNRTVYQNGERLFYYTDALANKYVNRKLEAGTATLYYWIGVSEKDYIFDLENLEFWINGIKRTDVVIRDYRDNHKGIGIEIPVTVAEYKEYNIGVMEGVAIADGVEVTKAYPGTQIFLVADDAPEGKVFREWDVNGARIEFPKDSETVFTMPGNNVSATATYSKPYTVTVKNGVLADTGKSTGQYFWGDMVIITANVYEGQTFAGWASDEVTVRMPYKERTSFTMPQQDVTVTANVSSAVEITELEMTSDISAPAIGWAVTDPAFTVTKGNPVYIKSGWWEKYDDTSAAWNNYSGKTFEEGKYRYVARFNIDFDYQEYYLMNENAAVTVNGNSWEITGRLYYEDSDKLTGGWIRSPEYTAVKKYRVSFNANGGTGTMEDDIVFSGKASLYYQLPENGFTAPEGKYFKGWGKTPDASTVISPSSVCPILADTTFYAIWGDITYIDTVDVTIPVPVLGERPQEGVSNTQGVSVSVTEWYRNGMGFSESDTFGAGNTYKVYVVVNADNGYEFSNSPKVTFNGSTVGTVYRFVDGAINYYAEFTIPPIDTVDVTIKEPVAGAFPQDAFSNTEGVSVSITEWSHNGVKMSSNYFVAGETYTVHVIVYPDGQNLFAENPTVTFNGSTPGTLFLNGVDYINYYAEFTAVEPTIIDAVDVKVTKPVAGAHPQDVVSNTDHAIVTAMEWRCDGKLLSASDTFEEGVTYQLTVVVGVDSNKYEFSDDTIITFNGTNTGKYVTNDYDYVIYDVWFTATAEPDGVTVSGTATSFHSDTDEVIIQLTESGASEPAYEAVVKGNSASYSIAGVAPGTYTMKVMKKNHVAREYTVTVSAENVTQNVKIHLLGDVNGNGRIQSNDLTMVYAHVSGAALITDSYILACADVNGNGRIQSNDITRILGHVSGGSPLW